MTISDIITLLTLIIAVLAIMHEKRRHHVRLKFQALDYWFCATAFILINYFVFYPHFYNKGLYLSYLYFDSFGLRDPKHYAYLITLLFLAYFFYKILFSFYPPRKYQAVINYYQRLMETQEISFLLDLIEQYHQRDIVRMISEIEDYDPRQDRWMFQFERPTSRKEKIKNFFKGIFRTAWAGQWENRSFYASMVLHNIMRHPAFIPLAAQKRPYMLAEIFSAFTKNKQEAFPNDIINPYLCLLLMQKDFWLVKELKASTDNKPQQPDHFYQENRIIGALLSDLTVADVNRIWESLRKAADEDISAQKILGNASPMMYEFENSDSLWKYPTWLTIVFYDMLICRAIIQKYEQSHFTLHNYRVIVEQILTNAAEVCDDPDQFAKTVYYQLIKEIIDRCLSWLEFCNTYEHPGLYLDILTCFGNIIEAVTESPFISDQENIDILDRWLRYYCAIDDNNSSDALRSAYEQKFLRPSMTTDTDSYYYFLFAEAWKKFDKIPHSSAGAGGREYDYFARLKNNVIKKLGFAD